MRTPIGTLLVLAALAGTAAGPAAGQQAASDPRWLAYVGCWEPVVGGTALLCVVPAERASAVDLVRVAHGEVVSRERIAATGERYEAARDDCSGWRSAAWSTSGNRLYLHSEEACAGLTPRAGSGLIAMTGDAHWLYIQAVKLGDQTGVLVERYQPATSVGSLPDEIVDALRVSPSATLQARAAAAARLSIADVIEAANRIDAAVVEAWLMERDEPFTLDADALTALADAGVAPRVIDLMVALSYPQAFAINPTTREGERLAAAGGRGRGVAPVPAMLPYYNSCSYLLPSYAWYDCALFGGGYGFGYGYRWYPGSHGVIIVQTGTGSARRHGRVVKGQGYREGQSTTSDAVPRTPTPRTWRAPDASTGSSGSSGSSSSSGSSGQRKAKPRP